MFAAAATDDDAATQVVDVDDRRALTTSSYKPANSDESLAVGSTVDIVCTQAFIADVHITGSTIAVENRNDGENVDVNVTDDLPTQVFEELSELPESVPKKGKQSMKGGKRVGRSGARKISHEENVADDLETHVFSKDISDDLPTQVFEELSEKVQPLNDKQISARGGKKMGRSGVKTSREENVMDELETQVFDVFIPPVTLSATTEPARSGVWSMEAAKKDGQRMGSRMSLRTGRSETSAVSNEATELELHTVNPATDDLATQVCCRSFAMENNFLSKSY